VEDIRFKNYTITDNRTGESWLLPDFIKTLTVTKEESELLVDTLKLDLDRVGSV